jgi:integrase
LAALLTESLWHDLERAMSSSRSLPDPAQIKALIDRWLKAQLDEDAYIRSMPHSMIHAGVILKRRGEGFADTVVRYLDDDETAEFESLSAKEQSERIGLDGYYLSQVDDQTLRKAAHNQMFEGAERRHRSEDGSVAEKHVADLFRRENIEVDPFSPLFEQTTDQMIRAHRDVQEAIGVRDRTAWRPGLDEDPAGALYDRVTSSLASQPPAPARPILTGRAAMTLGAAAREAIPEIARTEKFKPKRKKDYKTAIESFIAWKGYDPVLGEVTQQDAGNFNVALGRYPTNWKKRRDYRDLRTFEERRAKAVELDDPKVLGATTINTKYLAPLRAIFEWQRMAGSGVVDPFAGISTRKPRRADPEDARRDFTIPELQRLFALPLFTGSKGPRNVPLYRPGPVRVSDYRFWVPLICIFSGLRLNEACGLAIADIKSEGGVLYMHVRDEMEGQSIKAPASRRKVPIHHELLTLGLPEFVNRMKENGADRLFPELRLSASGYYSDTPSKFFAKLIDPPPFRWTPMLAFRSWRGVSDECSTPGVSGIVQAGGR